MLKERPELKKIRGSYILLRHDFEPITKDFSINDLLEVEEKLLNIAKKMKEEKSFEATPSNLCGWCDYLEHCEEGRAKVAGNSFTGKNVYGEIGY